MFAIIRIRSTAGVWHEMDHTLNIMNLKDINNCIVAPETPTIKGMLQKVKDFVTWGEVDKATLAKMMEKRLRIGKKKLDAKSLKEATKFDSFDKLADAFISGKAKIRDFDKLTPVFRLTPPSKGFRSTKNDYPKGDLGYRGKEINRLLERMI